MEKVLSHETFLEYLRLEKKINFTLIIAKESLRFMFRRAHICTDIYVLFNVSFRLSALVIYQTPVIDQ